MPDSGSRWQPLLVAGGRSLNAREKKLSRQSILGPRNDWHFGSLHGGIFGGFSIPFRLGLTI
jgi:hypothetical protein